MIINIKQKMISLTYHFDVTDENEQPLYKADGALFSIGDRLKIVDTLGNEVASIQQKVVSMLYSYYINIGGANVATLKKKITIGKQKYIAEELGWEIVGDFSQLNYTVTDAKGTLFTFKKKAFSLSDTYQVVIADGTDPLLPIATVIAIDCANAAQDKH